MTANVFAGPDRKVAMALFSKLLGAKPRDTTTKSPARPARRFTGVEVVPRRGACCEAVRAIAGQRFLSEEAPRLPLADCDRPQCDCRYQHFTDRRTDVRRDGDIGVGIASELYNSDCRRSKGRGRRSTDQEQ